MRTPRRRLTATLVAIGVISLVGGCTVFSSSDDTGEQGRSARAGSAAPVDTHGLRFTEVAQEAGLTAPQAVSQFYGEDSMTSGVAVADVDADGFDDILLLRSGLSNVLYLNNGDGTFRDGTEQAGLAEPEPTYGSSAAAFFDADGDGHLDLFTTGFGRGRNRLYLNNGDGTFTEGAAEHGIVFHPLPDDQDFSQMHGVTVGDVNGDGSLDLLVLQWYLGSLEANLEPALDLARTKGTKDPALLGACDIRKLVTEVQGRARPGQNSGTSPEPAGSQSRLFLNDGHGNFSDATAQMGLDFDQVIAFTGIFVDYDGDGWQDLAVTGDGCTSKLFHNEGGKRFTDVTATALKPTDENAMGAVFGDIDGDSTPDWLLSSIAYGRRGANCPVGGSLVGCSGNRLYLNNGDGTFRDATNKSGLWDGGWGWGLAAEDFTNTGELSVSMTNGFLERPDGGAGERAGSDDTNPYRRFISRFGSDPTRFWMKDRSGRFVDVARRVGISDTGLGHALVPFDYDTDGDLDLLIARSFDPPLLYRNDTPEGRSWLTIRLDDPTSPGNRWGDGARIEVHTEQGGRPRVGWITTGGSYESQKPPQWHLGFGDAATPVTRIDVYWPGARTPQTLRNVDLNQRLVITRD